MDEPNGEYIIGWFFFFFFEDLYWMIMVIVFIYFYFDYFLVTYNKSKIENLVFKKKNYIIYYFIISLKE